MAGLYLLSLVPSWRLYVRRRDIFKKHLAAIRQSFSFLMHAVPATRMRRHRVKLALRIRSLVSAYEQAAPMVAGDDRAAERTSHARPGSV